MAIPADRNSVQKEAEKKLKYKSLCVDLFYHQLDAHLLYSVIYVLN
jgi:hypothetical protein